MSIEVRFLMYFILSLFFCYLRVKLALKYTEKQYETDKSAYAWTGFLPFFLPIFYIEGLKYLAPIVIIIEIIFLLV